MSARRQILQRQEGLRRGLERQLRRRVGAELRYTANAVSSAYPSWENEVAAHALRMGTLLEQFYLIALKRSAGEVQSAVITKAKKKPSDNLGNEMRQWARENAATKVSEISKTTEEKIRDVIAKGVKDGLDQEEIADEIVRRTGGSIASSRALVISRTESHASAQAGGMMAAKDLGVVQTKEWISAEDDRTREAHAEADGQVVGIDEPFEVDGEELQFPGDPSGSPENVINCRCVVAYGFTPSDHADESADQPDYAPNEEGDG